MKLRDDMSGPYNQTTISKDQACAWDADSGQSICARAIYQAAAGSRFIAKDFAG